VEYLGVDEMILLKWILDKLIGKVWTGFNWFMTGSSGDSCDQKVDKHEYTE